MNGKSRMWTGWGTVLFGLALGLSLILTPSARAQCHYDVTIIESDLNCGGDVSLTVPLGINEQGDVVGYHQCAAWDHTLPFIWTAESGLVTLDPPPEVASARATDINEALQIVGFMDPPGPSGQQGFVWDNGEWITLLPEGDGLFSAAYANNGASQVAGYRDIKLFTRHGFLWTEWSFTDIGPSHGETLIATDANQPAQVVGWMGAAPETDAHAFLWEDGKIIDLGVTPGGFTGAASGINNLGDVVGSGNLPYDGPGQLKHAFLWTDGVMIDLGSLPDLERCSATDINDVDQIVGTCAQPDLQGDTRAFIWQNGVMWDLNELISLGSTVQLRSGRAINNTGQITAWAYAPGGSVGVLLTPVSSSPADLNADCVVNAADLAQLLGSWGSCREGDPCPADLDGNGSVNAADLAILLGNWG